MSGRSVYLTTLFLGRLRPPKGLTSTSCTYFRQLLTTALLEKRKEKRKYVARPGIEPRTPDLRVRCPTDCATRPGMMTGDFTYFQPGGQQAVHYGKYIYSVDKKQIHCIHFYRDLNFTSLKNTVYYIAVPFKRG